MIKINFQAELCAMVFSIYYNSWFVGQEYSSPRPVLAIYRVWYKKSQGATNKRCENLVLAISGGNPRLEPGQHACEERRKFRFFLQ